MKKLKKIKLKVEKEVVASLSNNQMFGIHGGAEASKAPVCNTVGECSVSGYTLNCMESRDYCGGNKTGQVPYMTNDCSVKVHTAEHACMVITNYNCDAEYTTGQKQIEDHTTEGLVQVPSFTGM